MTRIATHQATEDHAVAIDTSPRNFPRRSIDYRVTVIDRNGNILALVLLGTNKAARQLANTAWVALRNGVDPEKVWN